MNEYAQIAADLKQVRLNKISLEDSPLLDAEVKGNLEAIEAGEWHLVSIASFFKYLELINVEYVFKEKK